MRTRTTTAAMVVAAQALIGLVPAASAAAAPVAAPAAATTQPAASTRLLGNTMRLRDALTQVDAATLGRLNSDRSVAEIRSLAADAATWVDLDGSIYYADNLQAEQHDHQAEATATTASASLSAAEVGTSSIGAAALTGDTFLGTFAMPAEDTFLLESRPGSNRTIYLDFDGATVTGTGWNSVWGTDTITAADADFDGTPGRFTTYELTVIQQAWLEVAEDYAPFDVNVTTKDPGLAAIDRTNLSDQTYGAWVVISPKPAEAICNCTGLAYTDSFDRETTHMYLQPVWAFSNFSNGGDDIALIASHEVGHTFGLNHDGKGANGYYSGQGVWGPIMGAAFPRAITTWSNGDYTGATNTQDDLAIITANGLSYIADDHSNTVAGATSITAPFTVDGVISTNADVDVFTLNWAGGAINIGASPAAVAGNLDISLEIRDAAGTTTLASADPTPVLIDDDNTYGFSANISTTLAAGTYTIWVSGVGNGDLTTGYSDYGVLGRYRLTTFPNRVVGVTTYGTGSGTVISNPGTLISPHATSTSFLADTLVTLTATPAAGSAFAGWTGACISAHITCQVTVDRIRKVTATFVPGTALTTNIAFSGRTPKTDAFVMVNPGANPCYSWSITCTIPMPTGQPATVTADVGNLGFVGWSGACSGRLAVCTVDMSAARNVTATFATSSNRLTFTSSAGGRVEAAPYGVACGTACVLGFPAGDTVTLTATPDTGYVVGSWGGVCADGALTCTFTMNTNRTVTLTYIAAPTLTLRTRWTGTTYAVRSGNVTSSPAGITNCIANCTGTFLSGTEVVLTATNGIGWKFNQWIGTCTSSTATTCTVALSANTTIEAEFIPDTKALAVTKAGNGSGTVTSNVGGINCGVVCTGAMSSNTQIVLTASPAADSAFTGWSGAGCSGTGTCTVTMDAAKFVTATFNKLIFQLSVVKAGTGTGTVTSSPAGINCGATCSTGYEISTVVTLTAVSSVDSRFTGWSGAGCSGTGTCVVTMSAAQSVVATFVLQPDTFRPFEPSIRLVDTRAGQPGALEPNDSFTRFNAGEVRRYDPVAIMGIPAGSTMSLNAVVVNPSAAGRLAIYPCAARTDTPPNVAFMNYPAGVNLANAGLVAIGTGGFCVLSTAQAHVVIDASGWFTAGNTFRPLATPSRLLDTRANNRGSLEAVTDEATAFPAGTVRRYVPTGLSGLPASGMAAIAVNATAVAPGTDGTLQFYACSAADITAPTAVTVTYRRGVTINTGGIVPLDASGGFCVRSTGATHLVIDTSGWFPSGSSYGTWVSGQPRRLIDTRAGLIGLLEATDITAPLAANVVTRLRLGGFIGYPINAELGSVALTITALSPSGAGFIKAWACDSEATPAPSTAVLNFTAGASISNLALVATSTSGSICVLSSAATNLTIDSTGWFIR